MSVDGLRWAMRVKGLTTSQKMLLIFLGDYANEQGVSYPRHETLAERSSLTRETTTRLLKSLEQNGLICPVELPAAGRKRAGNTGRFTLKAYKLHMDRTRPVVGAAALEVAAAPVAPCDIRSQGESGDGAGPETPPCDVGSHGPCDERSRGEASPCDIRSLDHVTLDHRPIIGIRTSEGSELLNPREKEKEPLSLPTVRRRPGTNEEIDSLQQTVNQALGLTGKARLPAIWNLWDSIWRYCSGDLEEAATVARHGAAQCGKAGNPLSLVTLERRYLDWRSGAYQQTSAVVVDDLEVKRARRRKEMLSA